MKATINNFVTILLVSVVLGLLVGGSGATWCDTNYAKRINVSANNTGGGALTDYQVYVNLSANPINETSLRVYNATSCTLRPHWTENETSGDSYGVWINYSSLAASAWTNNTAIYYNNIAVSSTSNITNTFLFGDDFDEEGTTINETYLTSWTKSSNNPLVSLSCQNWFTAVYNNYNNEDKIYLFEQRVGNGDCNIYARSFNRTDAETPANWTDHGSIFTDSSAWCAMIVEPHSIVFETQTMADAREGVGVGEGTQKWRLYYTGESASGSPYYGTGFATASESDLLTWTAYSANPVYPYNKHGDGHGFPDGKAVIYDNEVWILFGDYTAAGCQYSFFSHSVNGIDNWTDASAQLPCGYLPGTLVSFDTGILISGRGSANYNAHFTLDGESIATYSNNPILSLGAGGQWDDDSLGWYSIVADKNGSTNLSSLGTYYMYYTGNDGATTKFGLATSTTLTEESETIHTIDTNKWTLFNSADVTFNEGIVNISGGLVGAEYAGIIALTNYSYGYAFRGRIRQEADSSLFGAANSISLLDDAMYCTEWTDNLRYYTSRNEGVSTHDTKAQEHANYHIDEQARVSGEVKHWRDGTLEFTQTTNVPDEDLGLIITGVKDHGYIIKADWAFVRKYAPPEPSATLGTEEQQGENPILHIGNAINIKEDWGRDFNSNLSANVTGANASDVQMNFTNSEFTNTSLGWLNLTLDEWVNESHNVGAPITNTSVNVYLNSTTSGATNDTNSFWYEITKRTNTATMDSTSTQIANTSETFYVNATCNEEYGDTFLGAANLLEDGAIVDTDNSVTNYVNFSHSEGSIGVYNYTIRFYNVTHYDNATTPTYSNVTVYTASGNCSCTQIGNTIYVFGANKWCNIDYVYDQISNTSALSKSGTEYLLNASLCVNSTTTTLYINNTVCTWLKLKSLNDTNEANITNTGGSLKILDTKITSWNTTSNSFATEKHIGTRAYILTSGASAKMNITNSNCSYLGYMDGTTKSGVGASGITSCVIKDSTFIENFIGAALYYADYSTIQNNTFKSCGYSTDGTKVGYSIYLYHADYNTITQNNATDTGYHVYRMDMSDYNELTYNTGYDNPHSFIKAGGQYNNISYNTMISGDRGFYSAYGTHNRVYYNYFNSTVPCQNVIYGTYLENNTFAHNIIKNKDCSVVVLGHGSNNTFINNTLIAGSGTGLKFSDEKNLILTDNKVTVDTDEYEYVFDTTSINNTIRNVEGTFSAEIQNTSCEVFIEYTDNKVFNESSTYDAHWYPNIANLSIGGTIEVVNISTYDFDITPSTGYLNVSVNLYNSTQINFTAINSTPSTNMTVNVANETFLITNGNEYTIKKDGATQATETASNYVVLFTGIPVGSIYLVEAYSGATSARPPDPTNLQNSTGNYYVNYTWNVGVPGNITDSYNVSWNLTWFNNTLTTYMQKDVGASGWANITVYAYNSSGNGSLSAGSISDETQAEGGTYTTPMTTSVYNLITYYGESNSTAEQFGLDIGNVEYIARYNNVTVPFTTHTMGHIDNNFTTIHGMGYFVFVNASGSTAYQRNNISDNPYNTNLLQRWNTIGWTNATDTNAEGLISSIGSACKYTSMLNADGWSYTTHTLGFTSNNHAVDKGKGYWVWVNAGVNWGRNS